MSPKNIVFSHDIQFEKAIFAKELRSNMTEAERVLWSCLRTDRLDGMHFRRQQVIAGYIVDFYCHKHALVIELDGKVHLQQIEYDAERDKIMQELGLSILRIENQEVIDNLEAVLQKIKDACSQS